MEEKNKIPVENEEILASTVETEPVSDNVETVQPSETAEVAAAGEAVASDLSDSEKKPGPFAGMKEQKGLKAKIKFFFDVLEKYPDVRQMVMFFLFSILCGAGQLITQFLLQYTLVYVPALGPGSGFKWFVFTGETKAEFIGFMAGAVVGQTMTYILNRKKTFRSTNNLAVSVTLYIIIAVAITIFQTLIPGWVTTPCFEAYRNANAGADPNGFVSLLITLTGTFAGGMTALVLSFIGNKFVVMRDWTGDRIKRMKAKIEKLEASNGDVAVIEKSKAKLAVLEEKDAIAKEKAQLHNEKLEQEEAEKAKRKAAKKLEKQK